MMTLAAVARDVQRRLEAGKDVAPREGRELVLLAMELEDEASISLNTLEFDADKAAVLEAYVARRLAGEPLQYIVGHAWFYGRRFRVNTAVLIPRPDTEVLVEACLVRIPPEATTRVLELGVGSGCIGGTLLAERAGLAYVGVEIDAAAAAVARENILHYANPARWEVRVQDGLNGIEDGPFDMLVSNPPYITEAEWAALEPDVRDFEPKVALTGVEENEDGLGYYRHLAHGGASLVRSGGWLCLETGWQQAGAVQNLLQEQHDSTGNAPWHSITITPDLAGRGRVVCAQRR